MKDLLLLLQIGVGWPLIQNAAQLLAYSFNCNKKSGLETIIEIFEKVLVLTPFLLEYVERVKDYCGKYEMENIGGLA